MFAYCFTMPAEWAHFKGLLSEPSACLGDWNRSTYCHHWTQAVAPLVTAHTACIGFNASSCLWEMSSCFQPRGRSPGDVGRGLLGRRCKRLVG